MSKKTPTPMSPQEAAKLAYRLATGKSPKFDMGSFVSSLVALTAKRYEDVMSRRYGNDDYLVFMAGKQKYAFRFYISGRVCEISIAASTEILATYATFSFSTGARVVSSTSFAYIRETSSVPENKYNKKFVAKLKALIALHGDIKPPAGKTPIIIPAHDCVTSTRSSLQPCQHTIAVAKTTISKYEQEE